MNLKLWISGFLIFLSLLPFTVLAKISLHSSLSCDFQYGQFISADKAETDTQKNILNWNFFDLFSSKPKYLSGGDTGSISVYRHTISDGISIWLKQGNGAHLFSIWPDGTAFWSKHNNLLGQKASQQFRGTCENIFRTN